MNDQNPVESTVGATAPEQTIDQPAKTEVTEQQGSSETAKEPEKKDELPKGVVKRINELTRKRYEAEGHLKAERDARAQLEARLAKAEGREVEAPATQQPDPYVLAKQIAEQEKLKTRVDEVWKSGVKEYKDFGDTVETLQALGLTHDVLTEILDSDLPHKVIKHFGDNPEEFAEFVGKSPRQQARAIALLEVQLKTPAPKPAVSNAPDPIRPAGSRNAVPSGPSDSDDIETWMKKEKERVKKLREQRR